MTAQPGPPTPPNYGAPGAPLTPDQERNWATLSHVVPLIAMVVSAGTLGFVGSLVIYLLYKDRGPFVRQHAANSLNIQIITGIVLLISFPLMLVLVGFLTYAAVRPHRPHPRCREGQQRRVVHPAVHPELREVSSR